MFIFWRQCCVHQLQVKHGMSCTFWYHIVNEFFRKISRLSSWLDFILIFFATSFITFCDESDFLENGKQGYLCMKNDASQNLYAPRSHRWLLCLLCIVFFNRIPREDLSAWFLNFIYFSRQYWMHTSLDFTWHIVQVLIAPRSWVIPENGTYICFLYFTSTRVWCITADSIWFSFRSTLSEPLIMDQRG